MKALQKPRALQIGFRKTVGSVKRHGLLGLIGATKTMFGFVPLWGNDVYFHALLALAAFYFGSITPATPAAARS